MSSKNTMLAVVGVVVVLALLTGGWFLSMYNGFVTAEESVDGAWAQVESQYQRRADLIPNLVSTVKGYATHEKDLLLDITNARSQWTAAVTPQEKMDAAGGMDSALSRLLMVVENYPDLKANENFLALQAQLEGTENRIAVERMRYNEQVRAYNTRIKKMPAAIIANMFGFDEKLYFEAEKGAETAPEVEF